MIVFQHDHIVQRIAMVSTASNVHCPLFSKPKTRSGFSCIRDKRFRSLNKLHQLASVRCNSTHALKTIEHYTFGGEDRPRRSSYRKARISFADRIAITLHVDNLEARVELMKYYVR